MRSMLIGCAVAASVAALPWRSIAADVSSEDTARAQQAMLQKEAAREKARAAMVQISAGELEDLRAKVASLQAQVDALRGRSASSESAAAPKRYTEIELGMTKAEVKAFVNQHSRDFSIIAIKASSGISKSSEQVTVRESGQASVTGNSRAVIKTSGQAAEAQRGPNGQVLAGAGQAAQVDSRGVGTLDTSHSGSLEATDTRNVEVVRNRGKREVIEIAKWTKVTRAVGTSSNSMGLGTHTDYSTATERAGTILVTLDDDVVTAVDAH